MKFAIVGGGITGCVSAYLLADAGHKVTIYERGPDLGGSLRDLEHDGEFWLRGCQYLSPHADWFDKIMADVGAPLNLFAHRYASWTRFDGSDTYRNDLAVPHFNVLAPSLLPSSGQQTMRDRFAHYGDEIGTFLSMVGRRCGHEPDALDLECALALQLSAVSFSDPHEHMLLRKKGNPLADAMFALPREAFGKSFAKLEAAIPQNGYSAMFGQMHNRLEKMGVEIQLNAGVTARTNDDGSKFSAYRQRDSLDVDVTVWCCNPVPLLIAAGLGQLDSPASRFTHIHCRANLPPDASPTYIQCFDPDSSVYRIFIYPSYVGGKVCIECHPMPEEEEDAAISYAQNVVQNMFPSTDIEPVLSDSFVAHVLFTPRDRNLIEQFNELSKDNGIVSGAWLEFGRDQKIETIQRSLNDYVRF